MRPSSTSESSQTTSSNVKSRSNTLPNCTARDRLSSSNQSRERIESSSTSSRLDRIDNRTPNKEHKTRPESEYQKNRIETSNQDRTIEAIVNVLGKGNVQNPRTARSDRSTSQGLVRKDLVEVCHIVKYKL